MPKGNEEQGFCLLAFSIIVYMKYNIIGLNKHTIIKIVPSPRHKSIIVRHNTHTSRLNSTSTQSPYSSTSISTIDSIGTIHSTNTIDKKQSQSPKRKANRIQGCRSSFKPYISLIRSLLGSLIKKQKSKSEKSTLAKFMFQNIKNQKLKDRISASDTLSIEEMKEAIKTLEKAKAPKQFYVIYKGEIKKI